MQNLKHSQVFQLDQLDQQIAKKLFQKDKKSVIKKLPIKLYI